MKKLALAATLSLTAFFSACSDDSSSPNSSSSDLPASVKTFFDLANVECNAARKCEKILVEDDNDYYQCDGVQQWNMIMEAFPSKVCPVESDKTTDGDKENSEDKEQPSNGNQNEQAGDNTTDTGNTSNTGDNDTDGEQTGDTPVNNDGKGLVSCILEISMLYTGSGDDAIEITTKTCIETDDGVAGNAVLDERCIDIPPIELDGGNISQKAQKGSGCPTDYTVKCPSSGNTSFYVYDEDATEENCKDIE